MKNKLNYIILIVISFFLFFPKANALTKLAFTNTADNQINTTIHFEEGFVGGFDIFIKVNGNVTVKDIKYNDQITTNNFTNYYSFDPKSNILNIKVTTGGIGTSHNLLNEKKELNLGDIIITSTSKKEEKYSFDINSLTMIDNNWNTIKIAKDDLTVIENVEFTYTPEKESNPSTENTPPIDNPENNPSENENIPNVEENETNENSIDKTPIENPTDEEDVNDEEKVPEITQDNHPTVNDESTHQNYINKYLIGIGSGLGIIILVIIGYIIYKKSKETK